MILILASRSPRRKELLKQAGIRYRVIPSDIEENSAYKRPDLIVRELAYKKALSVALKHPGSPVLGSDTLVYCKGQVLGKPAGHKDALRLLRLQNGSWQAVHTGVALIWVDKGIFLAGGEVTRCKTRRLTGRELKALSAKHHDKAGAYAVQDKDDEFVEKIEGRFDTVVGLSMNLVRKFMKKAEAAPSSPDWPRKWTRSARAKPTRRPRSSWPSATPTWTGKKRARPCGVPPSE